MHLGYIIKHHQTEKQKSFALMELKWRVEDG